MIRSFTRVASTVVLSLGLAAWASGAVTPGYQLEMTLRTSQESPGRPYTVTLPLDSAAARDLQSDPLTSIRPHLLEARRIHARSRGYDAPVFRQNSHDIVPLSGWRWRLIQAGSNAVVAQGSNRWR